MKNIFNIDSKYSAVMNKVICFAILNCFWIFSLALVVTGGAGTAAVFYCLFKYKTKGEISLYEDFKKAFKENFKQATLPWLLFLSGGFVLGADFYFFLKTADFYFKMPYIILVIFITILYLFLLIYFFPLLARFSNTTKNLLKFSLLMSFRHLGKTLVLLLTFAAVILVCYLWPYLIPFWIAGGFVFVMYFLMTPVYLSIFRLYGDKSKDYQGENERIIPDTESEKGEAEEKNDSQG